jgi:hypothetical protein
MCSGRCRSSPLGRIRFAAPIESIVAAEKSSLILTLFLNLHILEVIETALIRVLEKSL